MKLRELLSRAVKPRLHGRFASLLSQNWSQESDPSDAVIEDERTSEFGSLSGLGLVIEYKDIKGNKSQRIITCQHYSLRGGKEYLQAYCHHRLAPRSFRLDGIVDIFDPTTGESLSPVQAFFARFSPDKVTKSGLGWGLSVRRRADLLALLNALVFVARCDREFHVMERTSLESALTSFWLRLELTGNPDFDDILRYADRLAPDGEMFWIAMHRFREAEVLAKIFRQSVRSLVDADGVVRNEEAYWEIEIDEFLSANRA